MKRLALIIALGLPLSATAQDTSPDLPEDDGPSLMERGAKLFFRGLVDEMGPAMRELEALMREAGPAMHSFLQEMGPAMADLFDEVRDFSVYHPPEVLPNGDIILRRKTPLDPDRAEPDPAPDPGTGEIDI